MIRIVKQNQTVLESRNTILFEYVLDGVLGFNGFLELLNLLKNQQFELQDYLIRFEYDHSDVREPEHYINYNEFIENLKKEYQNTASIEMRFQKDEDLGVINYTTSTQRLAIFMPQKKELKR